MLEKELTAHLAARQIAETKCEKLHQRIKLLTRKLKSQEQILRKRTKETHHTNQNKHHSHSNGIAASESAQLTSATSAPSGEADEGAFVDSDGEEDEFCDENADTYTSFVDDDDPHFASDLDEDQIVEPQELQVRKECFCYRIYCFFMGSLLQNFGCHNDKNEQ